jgi:hypothetical protein
MANEHAEYCPTRPRSSRSSGALAGNLSLIRVLIILIALTIGVLPVLTASAQSKPAFVQSTVVRASSGNSASVTFNAANTAGNLIVAYVVWDNSNPVSLSDSNGNVYTSAVGPTKYSSSDKTNAQIFYASGVRAGSNRVTATFSTSLTSYGIIYIHEYSGVSPVSPVVDVIASGSGSAAAIP